MLTSLNVDRFLAEKPLAITVSGLEELRGHIMGRLALFDSGPRDFIKAMAEEMRAAARDNGGQRYGRGVGVIQVRGAISQHEAGDLSSLLFGGASTEGIARAFREFMADDAIGKIVFDIDSPGGTAAGVSELANEIRAARGVKPTVAVANSMSASAAYWPFTGVDAFYAAPGALVGSIGVYAMHVDYSEHLAQEGVKPTFIAAGEHKVEGNEFEPLADDARAHIQSIVDDTYAQFVADVAKGRGVSEATVRNSYGKGRVLTAKQAKAAGMIDGIYTLEQAISRPIQTRNSEQTEPAAETEPVQVVASVDEEGLNRLRRIRWQEIQERAAIV